jgi:hypothetical protein
MKSLYCFSQGQMPSPHNRSIVSYDSKEKQSLNRKYDETNERKFGNGIKKLRLWQHMSFWH